MYMCCTCIYKAIYKKAFQHTLGDLSEGEHKYIFLKIMKSILSDFPFFFSSGTNMYMYFQKKKKPSMFILVLFQCLKLKQPETMVALDRQQPVSAVRVRQVFVFCEHKRGWLKGYMYVQNPCLKSILSRQSEMPHLKSPPYFFERKTDCEQSTVLAHTN